MSNIKRFHSHHFEPNDISGDVDEDMSAYSYCQRIVEDLDKKMKKPLGSDKRFLIIDKVPEPFRKEVEELCQKLIAKGLKARLSRNTLIIGWEHL